WTRIGVVTRELWSKESQWHNHKYLKVGSIKPASLSLSRAKTARRLPELAGAASGHHRPRDRWQWNRCRVPYIFRPIPRQSTTCAGRKLRKNDGNSPKLQGLRSPSSGHHFRRLRHPGPDRPAGETVRRSSELGPGAVACTRHPPPGHLDVRAFWIKSVGMGDSAEFSAEVGRKF
ncbi:2-oxoglutarate and Fe(II)-dependent oxygenase superfamily protein, partial [Prunus dulcis]